MTVSPPKDQKVPGKIGVKNDSVQVSTRDLMPKSSLFWEA